MATLTAPITEADVEGARGAPILNLDASAPREQLALVDALLASDPDVELRPAGVGMRDLELLAHLPNLRSLRLGAAGHLESLDGLAHVPELDRLEIGGAE